MIPARTMRHIRTTPAQRRVRGFHACITTHTVWQHLHDPCLCELRGRITYRQTH